MPSKNFSTSSVDSEANNIWILFQNLNDDDLRILVADDGCGIPLHFEGEGGEMCDGIPWVMAFGNRGVTSVVADGNRKMIGKFGLGLSSSRILGKERWLSMVWSKRTEDNDWRSCFFEFSDIERYRHPETGENGFAKRENRHPASALPFGDTGTILVIDIPKARKERYRLGSMQNFVMRFASQTYRHHIANGLTIKVWRTNQETSAQHHIESLESATHSAFYQIHKKSRNLGRLLNTKLSPLFLTGRTASSLH